MLSRNICCILTQSYQTLIRSGICRILHKNHSSPVFLPGGGLEKLQGGIQEEKYFNKQNLDLMTKICEDGSKLKCENCPGNWDEFEKLRETSGERTALLESCSKNKHKNVMEEAFFLTEQCDNVKLLSDKLQDKNQKSPEEEKKL